MSSSSRNPASSDPNPNWIYDVFLSFCAKDSTAKSFASDLYAALMNAGLVVFRDDGDLRSEKQQISLSVLDAIEGSRISIIVFSRNYADSRWRMEELEKIIKCRKTIGQLVVPVFCDVDRSDVGNHTSVFGDAFKELKRRTLVEKGRLGRWRAALHEATNIYGFATGRLRRWRAALHEASNIYGFATADYWNESEVVKMVVERVANSLGKTCLSVAGHPVGVESRAQDVIKLLNSQHTNDVVLLGIWGMGGIGKTAIAKAVYNKINHNFEAKSFLSGISAVGEQDGGLLISLQEQIVYGISNNIDGRKRMLLVLDDVDDIFQLRAMYVGREWFGSGSRIIITTRNKHVLDVAEVDHLYRVTELDHSESLELFSWHAFRQECPEDDFVELSREVAYYTKGLPLALEVLGSYLSSKEKSEWKAALQRLKQIPNDVVQSVLKRSYDKLNPKIQSVFLEIASFFVGLVQNDVTHALNKSGYSAELGIDFLEARSLITIDEDNLLRMHNLLQLMGREIIQSASGGKQKDQPKVYEVFLSFRGEDTRASFISHLYASLQNAGIHVFRDDYEIRRGEKISLSLLQAIKKSRIAIVVLSRNYANSRWCMEELENIMQHYRAMELVVFPVFYGVDPSDVRNQTGKFGKSFNDLIRGISVDSYKVKSWKRELLEVGGTAGIVIRNSKNESEDIKKVVEDVTDLLDKTEMFVADHPVGVESRVKEVVQLLKCQQSNNVQLLGIWGMGGIGKTTIAKAIYNQVRRSFEAKSFLLNVREVWEHNNGQVSLQQRLLSNVYKTTKIKIDTIESGKLILKERLAHKRIFLVLDDVNELEQLGALCGSREWFGKGSRIIITTRNGDLLHRLGVDHVYPMKEMDENESLELFSWHAFKQASPSEGFTELSRDVVEYCGRLPLALQVIGSFLLTRGIREWKSVLKKLKVIPNDEILMKLKISFDGLSDDDVKEIFLDIAFFFIGMDWGDVIEILNDCGHFTEIGMSMLLQQSLLSVDSKNRIGMHDMLRDMGREIVRKKSKDSEQRSRFWLYEDLLDELSKDTRMTAIKGLSLKLPTKDIPTYLETKEFQKMKRLKLLQLAGIHLNGDYKYVSRDIRWLCWHGFPSRYTPANFHQGSLIAIELKYSNLEQVWKKSQMLKKLKLLNLSHSRNLRQTPDFSKLPNLEKLILKDCPSLSSVSLTIGDLSKILFINLKDCTNLCTLPRSIYKLKSLKTLILSGCSKIDKLEEDIEQMESLTTLVADNTAITRVPFAIVRSKSIGYISLCGFEGFSRDVFPSIVRSWMSPANSVLSLVRTFSGMSSLAFLDEEQNSNFLGLSSIIKDIQKLQRLWVKCKSEVQLNQNLERILDMLHTNHEHLETTRSSWSLSVDCGIQAGVTSSNNSLTSLIIQMGMNCYVANILKERILQKMPQSGFGFGLLPGDNYPNWLAFNGEGSSVIFEVPEVVGRDLKTIMCVFYFSSPDITSEGLQNVFVINYTKFTFQLYKRDALASFEDDDEWQRVVSHIEPGDEVKIIVVFSNGFTVKKTTVYFIYDEPIEKKTKHCPKLNKNVISSGADETDNPKYAEFQRASELHDDLDFIFGETVTTSQDADTPWNIFESDDEESNLDKGGKMSEGKAKVWSATDKRKTLEQLVQASESHSEAKTENIIFTSDVQDQYSIPNCIEVLKTLKEGGHLNGRQFSFAVELTKDSQNRVILMTLKDSMDALVEWIVYKYDL